MRKTKLMGILNVTPDSFYEGTIDHTLAIKRGHAIFDEGADLLDIGGESSRPGSDEVSLTEELNRVIPVIKALRERGLISIDTRKAEVADKACQMGARLINDISGFSDPSMIEVAKKYGATVCVMHMQGVPKTMQLNPHYPDGIIQELKRFFKTRVEKLLQAGLPSSQIILDPGIGFGKTVADNWEILHNLGELKKLGQPLLVGLSRKSFMSKILNKPPSDLLPATIAMNALAIMSKADFIRVHDVKEHRDVIDLLSYGEK